MTEWRRSFLHQRTGKTSFFLREVYQLCSEEERQLSAEFYERYAAGHGTGWLTPFSGVRQVAGPLANGKDLVRRGAEEGSCSPFAFDEGDLDQRLGRALAMALPNMEEEVAVAVSGGVDCWLLAALLRSRGYRLRGWYLETGIPGYCEREQVERSSKALDIPCQYLRADASDFVAAVERCIVASQTPIYNLHPVSKWIFATALQQEGITTVVTGDAADQVMRWEWDCDLLPLTLACFRNAGVRVVAPFMADEVIGFCRQPFSDKQPVRALARRYGVPVVAKHPTLFPSWHLPATPRATLPLLETEIGRACEGKLSCLAYTTGLLQQWLEEPTKCTS